MIRTFRHEALRYGEYSRLEEFVYDTPFQWGSKRTGPDLHRVGGKYANLWHYLHLDDPRSTSPGSNMPSYAFLAESQVDREGTAGKMRALRTIGVPYTDEQIAAAAALQQSQAQLIVDDLAAQGVELDPGSEMTALIAYLQRLGRGPHHYLRNHYPEPLSAEPPADPPSADPPSAEPTHRPTHRRRDRTPQQPTPSPNRPTRPRPRKENEMYQEFYADSHLLILPIIALGLFVASFLAILYWVVVHLRDSSLPEYMANLPLHDEPIVETPAARDAIDDNPHADDAIAGDTIAEEGLKDSSHE